jgi:mannitol/fructose-specific phosphotransferase system IIA component (Ntr-type)
MQTKAKDYWKLFKPKNCSLGLGAADKDGVLREVVAILAKGDLAPELVPAAIQALLEREQLASTGVGRGVAIPHVKLEGLDSVVVSVGVHKEGVEWSAVDGEPVHLVFTVLRPVKAGAGHEPERHLEMMQWLSRVCRDRDFRRFALAVKNRTELVDLLKEHSAL